MIALVGGDGAGKSTALGLIHDWMRRDLDVRRYHLGRPPRSLTTHAVRGTLKAARSLAAPFASLSRPASAPGSGDDRRVVSRMLGSLCLARDRYLTFTRARRFANNGGIALCDRFPIPMIRLMDAPAVESIGSEKAALWLVERLSRIERRFYAAMVFPEILIVLRLDPEIAVSRKTEERPQSVRERSREIWEADWTRIPALVVDASQPRDAVLSRLKELIWARL